MEEKSKLPILLFDQECGLCLRFKESLKRLDGMEDINFIAIQNDKIYKEYNFLNKEKCFEVVHFIKVDHTVLTGSEVIEYLVKLNPTVSKFTWLIDSEMGKKAIDYFHRMTNHYRDVIKRKCPECVR